jgi:hypothetical protein
VGIRPAAQQVKQVTEQVVCKQVFEKSQTPLLLQLQCPTAQWASGLQQQQVRQVNTLVEEKDAVHHCCSNCCAQQHSRHQACSISQARRMPAHVQTQHVEQLAKCT